jgi:hypothetical protein
MDKLRKHEVPFESFKDLADNIMRGFGFQVLRQDPCIRFPHMHVYTHHEGYSVRLFHGRRPIWFVTNTKIDKVSSGIGLEPMRNAVKAMVRRKKKHE